MDMHDTGHPVYPYNKMMEPKAGVWSVRSAIDPRWNSQGHTKWLVSWGIPPEAKEWISACTEHYDIGPAPKDLTWGFEKY